MAFFFHEVQQPINDLSFVMYKKRVTEAVLLELVVDLVELRSLIVGLLSPE